MSDVIVAIDAMGGDYAPAIVIEGLAYSLKRYPNTKFLIFGDKQKIDNLIEKHNSLKIASQIIHCDSAIAMDEKPSQALRKGQSSSMWKAIEAVKNKQAHVVVSAGNTGALMAISKYQLRTMPEIDRPAIAAVWPTQNSETIVLDIGANVDADAKQLFDFSIMGAEFARILFQVNTPTLGLLNVGTEAPKGNEVVKAAAEQIREQANLSFEFKGFVEGNDIAKGVVDVVVTDGFTGNIALKTAEGTAKLVGFYLKSALSRSFMAKIGVFFARKALKTFKEKTDPRRLNGGVFLGLNGLVVKSHGGTDALGFACATDLAIDLAKGKVIEAIQYNLSKITFGNGQNSNDIKEVEN